MPLKLDGATKDGGHGKNVPVKPCIETVKSSIQGKLLSAMHNNGRIFTGA